MALKHLGYFYCLLTINTATIDTGYMNKHLHGFCASRFFIFTLFAQVYNTAICVHLYNKTKALNLYNLYLKYFMFALLVVQLIYS